MRLPNFKNHLISIALLVSILGVFSQLLFSEPVLANQERNQLAATLLRLQESNQRWIQVNLSRQTLYAWEGNKLVFAVKISTGKKGYETPAGSFNIQSKHRLTRMQGEDYDVPDVPFTMYYHQGYAIHGTYWHRDFGTPVSHGCTNVALDHAERLFNWAEVGTPVIVHQ